PVVIDDADIVVDIRREIVANGIRASPHAHRVRLQMAKVEELSAGSFLFVPDVEAENFVGVRIATPRCADLLGGIHQPGRALPDGDIELWGTARTLLGDDLDYASRRLGAVERC